jgi:lambda family phage portal protein
MNFIGALNKLFFGYNAIVDKNRRKRPLNRTQGEDFHMDMWSRDKALASQRDQYRNLAWVAWACRTHLDYVSEFKFRATSDDQTWNKKFEKLIKEKSEPNNCDVAGRHSFDELMRLFEQCKVTDGDCGLMKVRDGARLQAIESDRIRKPVSGTKRDDISDLGLVLDDFGKVKWYAVCKRDEHDMIVFQRMVKAQNMFFDGYYSRFDQTRGISPLLSALNTNQDLAEAFEYTLIKTKFHAMLGMAITRENVASKDGWEPYGNKLATSSSGQTSSHYNFEMRPGLKLELEPGDNVNMLESKTPNEEFVPYTEAMLRCALLAFDIPFSFYNSQQFSYNAGRQDTIRYIKSAKQKQDKNRRVRDGVTRWWLDEWLIAGEISVDEYNKALDNGWHWQASGSPLIDPAKEVPAMTQMIANGLKSRSEIINEMGGSFEETAKMIKLEEETFEALGIKGIGVGQPGQTVLPMIDEEIERQKGGRPTVDEDDDPTNDSDEGMSSSHFLHGGRVYYHDEEGILRLYDPTR